MSWISKYILVFDDLRPGCPDGKKYLLSPFDSNIKMKGYKMLDGGAFPYIIRTNKDEDYVICDKVGCLQDDEAQITRNYTTLGFQKTEVFVNGNYCAFYYYTHPEIEKRYKTVEGGDWKKYNKQLIQT